MGGLLAARVLSAHFDKVTVFDRDSLPPGVENRRGVPQGRHGHAILASEVLTPVGKGEKSAPEAVNAAAPKINAILARR